MRTAQEIWNFFVTIYFSTIIPWGKILFYFMAWHNANVGNYKDAIIYVAICTIWSKNDERNKNESTHRR